MTIAPKDIRDVVAMIRKMQADALEASKVAGRLGEPEVVAIMARVVAGAYKRAADAIEAGEFIGASGEVENG